jgi:hypothetical protein
LLAAFASLFRHATDAAPTVATAPVTPVMGSCSLWLDYVYLARDERRRFAQSAHEYLIEQLQFGGDESFSGLNNKIKLNFNHPVKELVWVAQGTAQIGSGVAYAPDNWSTIVNVAATNALASGPAALTPVDTALLQLNGHDRFAVRKGEYFNYVQPWQHHTKTPAIGVSVYSFCEKPEEHQPSGSANFSRIDNANLVLQLRTLSSGKIRVYAVNYNVLRIMSGMGGLAFAN